jgi:hypothetical protein
MIDGVEVAGGKDLTAFAPHPPLFGSEDYDPAAVGSILDRLRSLAVDRLLSLDVLDHPDLVLRAAVPAGPPGIAIHVYELSRPSPRFYVACGSGPMSSLDPAPPSQAPCEDGVARLSAAASPNERRYQVDARGADTLILRDSYALGWRAKVDGRDVPVQRVSGRHQGVPVPEGTHQVVMVYEPPGLRLGLAAFGASLVLVAALSLRGASSGKSDP